MPRPKSLFSPELALRARADLNALDQHGVVQKLCAIIAASKLPTALVAEVISVAEETIWRWAKAYESNGIEGLRPKTRHTKPSKLTPSQKTEVLSWIDECKTPHNQAVHWTLERLRQAITDQFGVTLGINTLWVWLRKEDRKLNMLKSRQNTTNEQAQTVSK